MATASLLNMTVPAGTATNQGLLMPKLKYRFRVYFVGLGKANATTTEMTKQVIDFTRPNVNFNPITIDVYNSKVYLTGKPEWQTVTVNLRDDAAGQVNTLVGQQLQKQFDFAQQASAVAGIDYKFTTRFQALDGGNGTSNSQPTVLEDWELYGCFISEANFNNFEYSSNDPATISLTLRYDNAIQAAGGYVGTSVGRTFGASATG
jgi:hypothetical protein